MTSDVYGSNIREILTEANHIAQPKALAVYESSKFSILY